MFAEPNMLHGVFLIAHWNHVVLLYITAAFGVLPPCGTKQISKAAGRWGKKRKIFHNEKK